MLEQHQETDPTTASTFDQDSIGDLPIPHPNISAIPAPRSSSQFQPSDQIQHSRVGPVRPGPKSKAVAQRSPISFAPPRKRLQHSHTREFKIRVLSWWTHGQVPSAHSPTGKPQSPTIKDVSLRYQIPISTLPSWRENELSIVNSKKYASSSAGLKSSIGEGSGRSAKWPEMEAILYSAYKQRREERKAVRRGWLRRQSLIGFKAAYPERNIDEFTFSDGWFQGFLSRYSISLRFTTNKSQKLPEEYLSSIIQWLRFNRRNSQLRIGDEERVVGRYL